MEEHVPQMTRVSPRRREADKMLLRELVTCSSATQRKRRPRPRLTKRLIVITALITTVVGTSTAAAAIVLTSQNPTVTDQARCYSEVSTNFSASFPGWSVAVAGLEGQTTQPDVPQQMLSACAAAWSNGAAQPGFNSPTFPHDQQFPVPSLVACVLPSGEAAAFPGNSQTCAQLGLPEMSPQATRSGTGVHARKAVHQMSVHIH
jgi:hypothetical protein